eukprot:TRINITY_DN1184_c0_g1_i1.p1 TRINITY_DN1184_c0_g1~~TRINITY_DN1184_c0_g1_i1.p1  ORF type:complete len:224 (-),score=40.86 TRINITY_DN1184_c0_g1_i1:244-915(-)
MAPLFGAGCVEAYRSVFADESPETWCWLGYQGNNLVPAGRGTGGIQEMIAEVDDSKILYGFLRLNKTDDGGDSKRVKFVYLTWVGESASPIKRGKVTVHKKECAGLFKGFHVEKQIYDRDSLKGLEEEIDSLLKKAGGANYDLGNTRTGAQAGNSEHLKSQSKNFFRQKEQETQIKNIVYNKGPLTKGITACDLGGRQFVAPASEAKRNTVGYSSPSKTPENA